MSKNFGNTIKSANLTGKTFAIALILLLAVSSAILVLPLVKAQLPTETLGQKYPYSSAASKGSNGLWNVPTFPGLTVAPDPVGVGQPVQCIMIIELLPPSLGMEATTGTYGGWLGFMLTITNPNGTSTTLGPYESDVSGTYQVTYTPTTVGTYTFQFTYPGQVDNGTGYGNYFANFLPSTSAAVSLTVQQAQLTGFSEAPVPLPTQYWTTPINAQNRAWNSISGPWLVTGYNATGAFNPYTYAPQSAHILWAKTTTELQNALVGGQYGSLPFGGTAGVTGAIQSNFKNPIIMGGYVYYASAPQVGNTQIAGENSAIIDQAVSTESCMDLQTGQVIWTVPTSTISGAATPTPITIGQILDWRSQQQRLCFGYLWSIGSIYQMYDASTGALLAQWSPITAGTKVASTIEIPYVGSTSSSVVATTSATPMGGTVVLEEPHTTVVGQDIGGGGGGGALLVYILGYNAGAKTQWLACWNSTLAVDAVANDPTVWPLESAGQFPSIQYLQTTPLDWEWGIMWNMTIPLPSPMFTTKSSNTNIQQEQGGGVFNVANVTWGITGADGQYVILSTPSSNYLPNGIQYKLLAAVNVAAQPETTTTQVDVPGDTQFVTAGSFAWQDNITQPVLDQGGAFSLGNGGNIIFTDTSTLSLTDYSESTGALLWSTNPFNNDFSLQSITTGTIAYGMLYNPGYDGYMHAINMTTGVQVWDSITRPGGLEMPEPGYPTSGISVAGATINTGEVFTSTNKAYETMPAYRGHCLYAYNALTGAQNWNVSGEFIGGYLVADGILLTQNSYDGKEYAFGMGQTATTVEAPMNQITAGSNVIIQGTVTDQSPGAPGTPAISDTWMTPWMNYLYMEQPLPTQATGVNVSLDAIDPNGNLVHVGNATSDLTGNFIYQWTPPNIPGKYTIIATFSSDKSYYGSCGETGMTIASPAAAAASPTATPTSVADMYFVPAIAGLAVLIIIGLIILALLMIRKRP